ncbi:MAG: SUMF1/EgtB/PvdO family nonheme iron enzyme [Planctomycetota bacterium]|nr:SUMF1/EgtB/PvdO family nonheme iron enzyme [Planctomycetota bacterium]
MRRTTIIAGVTAAAMTLAGVVQGQTHAPWPTDWNNWNDPALWCTVGDPGNVGDTRYPDTTFGIPSYGAVPYTYKIGKFEVTAGQYTAFLNAVAARDTYALYNSNMDTAVYPYGCNIKRTGSSGSFTYNVAPDYANRPVNFVSWGDAARFVNWLTNGQLAGAQDASTTEDGSYYLNGATLNADLMAVTRKTNAKYVIPTEDEWYKAAYYKGGSTNAGYWTYPTRSNAAPGASMADAAGNNANYGHSWDQPIDSGKNTTEVGEFQNSPGPYGTFDQGGNVEELNETAAGGIYRGQRGGLFNGDSNYMHVINKAYHVPTYQQINIGFRVAAVPEPVTFFILFGAVPILSGRKRRK